MAQCVAIPSAHAALITGSWVSPAAGSTVYGTVRLDFKTQNTAVTFILPGGNKTATVSGGEATASWDTTLTGNGSVTIEAQESDATGPSTTPLTVTVANPVSTPASPLTPVAFSLPAGGTISPGFSISISSANYSTVTLDDDSSEIRSLPVDFFVPYTSKPGPAVLTVNCVTGCSSASLSYVVAGSQPSTDLTPAITSVQAPRSFFPRRDGYLDNFAVTIGTDQPVTAHLYLMSGRKIVARGTAKSAGASAVVAAGAGLKPGTYTWVATVVGAGGKTAKTRVGKVTADGRHLVSHQATIDSAAAETDGLGITGPCSTTTKAGGSIVLTSHVSCDDPNPNALNPTPDVSEVLFVPALRTAPAYGRVSISVTTGRDLTALIVFRRDPEAPIFEKISKPGTVTATVGPIAVNAMHRLAFVVGTADGLTATVLHVHVAYTYYSLSK